MEATPGMIKLGLKDWPFTTVPDLKATFILWADRTELKRETRRLFNSLSIHNNCTLHLVWAMIGEGKTHTLLYLRQLALESSENRIFPVYAILPIKPKDFFDVYREIIRGIGIDRLVDTYVNARSNADFRKRLDEVFKESVHSLQKALEVLAFGTDDMKQIAYRWILADKSLRMAEVRSASIPEKIRDDNYAVSIITALANFFLACGYSRLLVMIDEYQRTGEIRGSNKDDINTSLHTLYNECSQGLSIVLSFSFDNPSAIKNHLSKELNDRADWNRVIRMPAMSEDDANIFLKELLASARDPSQEQKINEDIVPVIINCAAKEKSVKPRRLNQIMTFVLEDGLADIQEELIEVIDAAYAQKLLDTKGPPKEEEEV